MYIKFEVSQERIREYLPPNSGYLNSKHYTMEINYKDYNISHIVARKEDGLYIISFYEWIYDINKDSHWLKEFDSIVLNSDRYVFDYGKIKAKILERYPKLEILKTEVFDSKDKLIDKIPDRITFEDELERHKTPDRMTFKKELKSNNIEFESDNLSDLLEKNPMNFDEMHFKTEEEKEDEYINNELRKAKRFKYNYSIIKKLFDCKKGFFKYNLDLITCFLYMLLSIFGIMESNFESYLFSFSLGSLIGCLIYSGIRMY